jgi:hypothetical protein
VIDESGEDYLYPADFFVPIELPKEAAPAFTAAHASSTLPRSRRWTKQTCLDESREEFDDCQVSTLRRYVTALGGNLELVAAFGNKKIVLSGVESGTPAKTPARKMQRTTGAPRRSRHAGRR